MDRDGVINVDTGYAFKIQDIRFIEGIFEICRVARNLDYLVIIVTNQSGIGRGFYSEDDFHKLMSWMKEKFTNEGCSLTDIFFCPYHPTAGVGRYRRDSFCRKPGAGMIFAAKTKYSIDLSKSILIGDSSTDIAAGMIAKIGKNLHLSTMPDHKLRDQASYFHIKNLTFALNYL